MLTSALFLGLVGSSHCFGMCGGIITSLSFTAESGKKQYIITALYHLGRLSSYTFLGLLFGLLGAASQNLIPFVFLKLLSAILLILMGFYISKIWMAISVLEKAGKILWDKISPLSKNLLPVKNYRHALLLGALWGWLPCGLVYSTLTYSLTLANPFESALFMLFFGIGTLPATLLAGAAGLKLKTWINHPLVRWPTAMFFIAVGLFMVINILYPELISSAPHSHHH
ncbi:MAG: sulfite exporter TauE/SafE family protein [Gammaproteobacteria bacterium]|nr:sulfite exporter TauE/SafE family protein [Gammaproteobacteria bacterium]MDH5628694.1 sulfite exporter TauE/SafE family protein [Gammaproteobacteria bacterium]